ncbi:hypothetical protein ACA351_01870 [Orientia tsutsugamushi]|uniref:hypothetical protein n=1 Tax=Orientia tsutsugamushi TaxID=784 RepID=UPI003528D019
MKLSGNHNIGNPYIAFNVVGDGYCDNQTTVPSLARALVDVRFGNILSITRLSSNIVAPNLLLMLKLKLPFHIKHSHYISVMNF